MVKIIEYGDLFCNCFIKLWNDSISIKEISSEMKLSFRTVKKIAHQLHLPDRGLDFSSLEPQDVKIISRNPKEEYREKWLANLRRFPDSSYSQLIKIGKGLYTWLLRNDRQWLNENRPSKNKNKEKRSQAYWKAKDLKLSETIQTAANNIRTKQGKPVKVTMTAILIESGHPGAIRINIQRLPIVQKMLEELVESPEAFALKRIDWVGKSYKEENITPTITEFRKRAGIYNMMENRLVVEYAGMVYKNFSVSSDPS